MVTAQPRLLIEQKEVGNDLALVVSGDLVSSWPPEDCEIWAAPRSTIIKLNSALAEQLNELLLQLGDADPCVLERSEKHLAEYVRLAHDEYWQADETPYKRRMERLNDELLPFIASARTIDENPLAAAQQAPVIEYISTLDAPVPFELLPLGQRPRPGATLLDSCLQLPAFTTIVRHFHYRTKGGNDDKDGRALITPSRQFRQLARAFLRSTRTKRWKEMEAYFRQEVPRRPLDVAPNTGMLDSREWIANYLVSPWPLTTAAAAREEVSDIHVYAHGETGGGGLDKLRLVFEYHPKGPLSFVPMGFKVRTLELNDALANARGEGQSRRRPLIWLNCCEAGGVVGEELFSFIVRLAELGCGVIAPRTKIPEQFATNMAQDFYRYLNGPAVPAVAFLAARLNAVRERHNPLGLAFVGLGNLQ